MDIPLFLPTFFAGIATGFYVRDRVLRARESQYLAEPRVFQHAPDHRSVQPRNSPESSALPQSREIDPARAVSTARQQNPAIDRSAPIPLKVDGNAKDMSDELRALLKLLDPD